MQRENPWQREPGNENQATRTRQREPDNENQTTRTRQREPGNENQDLSLGIDAVLGLDPLDTHAFERYLSSMQSDHADDMDSLTERVANALLVQAARSRGSRIDVRYGEEAVILHQGGRATLLGQPELIALLEAFGGPDDSWIPTDLVQRIAKRLTSMAEIQFYARKGHFEIMLGLPNDPTAPHACFVLECQKQGIVVEVTRALAP